MSYLDKQTYRGLYARYLSENGRHVSELLDKVELSGKRVLDLCGGAGELSIEAQQRGASVVMVDKCADMSDPKSLMDAGIQVHIADVHVWLLFVRDRQLDAFDSVFCRQAVNYWLDKDSAESLATNIKPGGKFVFNTFNKKPSTKIAVKEYSFEGVEFVELAWLRELSNSVIHIQCRENWHPHITEFSWISPEDFRIWLEPFFHIEEQISGTTSIYTCTKL